MTRQEYAAALKRNGFKHVLLWICRPAKPEITVGAIIDRSGKLHRRATIAWAIKEFARHDAAAAKARHQPVPPLLAAMGAK